MQVFSCSEYFYALLWSTHSIVSIHLPCEFCRCVLVFAGIVTGIRSMDFTVVSGTRN